MKRRVAICLIFLFGILENAFSQSTIVVSNLAPISYKPKALNMFIGEKSKPFYLLAEPEIITPLYTSKPLGCTIHYEAFFCRMELKITEHLPFWIRIHAGDYDSYTEGSGINK